MQKEYSLLVHPAKELTEIQRFYSDQLRDILERIHQSGARISISTEECGNTDGKRDLIRIKVIPKA